MQNMTFCIWNKNTIRAGSKIGGISGCRMKNRDKYFSHSTKNIALKIIVDQPKNL